MFPMLEQVLDLDRHVVGDAGELTREGSDHATGMANTVPEVGIAKCDVLRARRHLRAHVLQHHAWIDDAEAAAVDGDDRTVPAQVLAPAAGLRVARHALRAIGPDERGVLVERGQTAAIRRYQSQARDRGTGDCPPYFAGDWPPCITRGTVPNRPSRPTRN